MLEGGTEEAVGGNSETAATAAAAASEPSWSSSGRTWLQQIEKDLPRTFPKGTKEGAARKASLRRILAAYALRNPSVGYCQGLNFVAGLLLLSGMEEEEAFYSLCSVVEDVLQGNYDSNMMATQVWGPCEPPTLVCMFPPHFHAGTVIPLTISNYMYDSLPLCFPLHRWIRVCSAIWYGRSSPRWPHTSRAWGPTSRASSCSGSFASSSTSCPMRHA